MLEYLYVKLSFSLKEGFTSKTFSHKPLAEEDPC